METKNGVVETYYENGKLKSRENYKDGNLDGLREVWHMNGKLKSRETYKDDKLDGLYETWYDNGKPCSRANYKDGVAVEYTDNKYEQNMVEQESDRNASEEELLRLDRENLAMKIMLLRDKQLDGKITLKESLKQSVELIEEYDKPQGNGVLPCVSNRFVYVETNQDTLTNGTIIYNFNTNEEDIIIDYKIGRSSITAKGRVFHVSAHCLGGGWKAVRKTYC